MFTHKTTKEIKIGNIKIGADTPIRVQSMTKTATTDLKATLAQIKELENSGCEIIRVSVPDIESAKLLGKIKKEMNVPLVADIHFDYKLAIESINQGVDKIRINPGNIGSKEKVKQIVELAKERKIPIRIGLNSGSCENLVQTCFDYIKMFEDWNFFDIVISLKASDVLQTIKAYQSVAEKVNYPLHIGITEAGPLLAGTIKSSTGIGILLYQGLGDTIRVSLTTEPTEEVKVAYLILQSLNLRNYGIELITCPTCARCKIDLKKIVSEFEKKVEPFRKKFVKLPVPVKVAIMGCEVNGPGEAKHADIGIAGGKNTGLLFKKGKPVKKISPENWIDKLIQVLLDFS